MIPDLNSIFESEVVFGYTLQNPFIIAYGAYTILFFLLFSIISNILIWLLIRSLYKQKTLMSKQNFNMQLSLFTAIAIQVTTSVFKTQNSQNSIKPFQFFIPFFFGVIPTSVVTVLVQLHFENVTGKFWQLRILVKLLLPLCFRDL